MVNIHGTHKLNGSNHQKMSYGGPTKAKWIGQSSPMDIGMAILLSKVALVISNVCGPRMILW